MQYENNTHISNNENYSKEIKMESSKKIKKIIIDKNQETINSKVNLKFIENISVTEYEKKFYANKRRTVYRINYLLNGENCCTFRSFNEFESLFKQVHLFLITVSIIFYANIKDYIMINTCILKFIFQNAERKIYT